MLFHSNNPEGPVIIVSKDIVYAFPFGIAYVAGYLRQKGEDVRGLRAAGDMNNVNERSNWQERMR